MCCAICGGYEQKNESVSNMQTHFYKRNGINEQMRQLYIRRLEHFKYVIANRPVFEMYHSG